MEAVSGQRDRTAAREAGTGPHTGKGPRKGPRKVLNRNQAEYLAKAIEKGLIVTPEELRQRVEHDRQAAQEREGARNRQAAAIGSTFSSTWPGGGERLRVSAHTEAASLAIDTAPWQRASKPRALTDAERARLRVYRSQSHLFNGLTLQDGCIALRPLNPTLDLAQVVDVMLADEAVSRSPRFAGASDEPGAAMASGWVDGLLYSAPVSASELYMKLQEDDPATLFSVVDTATGQSIGVISLRGNAPEFLRVEIARIVLPQSLRCSAVLVQSLSLLLQHVFETIQYVRIQMGCSAASQRLASQMQAMGFKFEGIKRCSMNDLLVFRMLDTDWLAAGKSACKKMLEDCSRHGNGAAEVLSRLLHRTSHIRDTLLQGNVRHAHAASKAVLEQLVAKVAALTFGAVLSYERDRAKSLPVIAMTNDFGKRELMCTGAQEKEKETCDLIGQESFRMGALVGNYIVLQTLEPHGGIYDGQSAIVFSELTGEEILMRFGKPPPTPPPEALLQLYLWKLHQRNGTTFALRVDVKGDGMPRAAIARSDLRGVGYLVARVVDYPCRTLEIGPMYLQQADEIVWTEIWQLLMEHAFDAGVQRIELLVDPAASECTTLLRLGFNFEATQRLWHMREHQLFDIACFSMVVSDREQIDALLARNMQNLIKDELDTCLFAPLSKTLEFTVAFKNTAFGVELSDEPPIYVKSIHPTKGLGLPSTLTALADPQTGPFLVAINGVDAHGLTRKEVLARLRELPRPVIMTFRGRPHRPKHPRVRLEDGYKSILGTRANMLSEMFKREHPDQYRMGPGGWVATERREGVSEVSCKI